MASEDASVESYYVTNPLDGVRLHCLRWGTGPRLIVAIHGLTGHAWHWRRTAERLGSEYTLVSYDLRGHGDSEKPQSGYTYGHQRQDLEAVVAHFAGGLDAEAERPVIIGHSLGARVAMPYVTARHPRGFVIVDPGITPHVAGGPPRREGAPRRRPLQMGNESREEFMTAMQRTNFLRNWHEHNEEYAAQSIEPVGEGSAVRLKLTPWALQQTQQAIGESDLIEYFSHIACPTLIIRATEGHLSQPMAERMREEIGGSELIVIEDSNHNVMLDRPDAFDAALEPFLERVFA